jgi:feruloyl-CoA synthase
MLAAMHVGVPIAPISPAYSLMSQDFAKLTAITSLIDPRLVFVDDAKPFARAVAAITGHHDFDLVAVRNLDAAGRRVFPFSSLMEGGDANAVRRAFADIQPETIAKFLFTSGSTGEPKGVINTHRMLCSDIQSRAQAWPFLYEEPPVLVDWLPWNHTFGGNNDFGLIVAHGGTLYIDRRI